MIANFLGNFNYNLMSNGASYIDYCLKKFSLFEVKRYYYNFHYFLLIVNRGNLIAFNGTSWNFRTCHSYAENLINILISKG
jgi:hypothetical protein